MTITDRTQSAKIAARQLRTASTETKNHVLAEIAAQLDQRRDEILAANQKDLDANQHISSALLDRLTLTHARLDGMIESLHHVIALPDPVGECVESIRLENGLFVQKVRSSLGVILMIFESRPNIAIEAFSLGFKAGNAMILRGGKESAESCGVLYQIIRDSLNGFGLQADGCVGITDPDRAIVETLLKQTDLIDLVIPRGGHGLIDYVQKTSQIPILKHDRGLCHLYVHEDADLDMAAAILKNGKSQRPSVCNALETVLVHRSVASAFLPTAFQALAEKHTKWHCDQESYQILSPNESVYPADEDSFDQEYLDHEISCAVVADLDEAINHIETHGSLHSESIVTKSRDVAKEFQSRLDSAVVYWNASTRFTDGFSLGMGGEIGISTQKLHARGPVGLRELTSIRWVIDGEGQIR